MTAAEQRRRQCLDRFPDMDRSDYAIECAKGFDNDSIKSIDEVNWADGLSLIGCSSLKK